MIVSMRLDFPSLCVEAWQVHGMKASIRLDLPSSCVEPWQVISSLWEPDADNM